MGKQTQAKVGKAKGRGAKNPGSGPTADEKDPKTGRFLPGNSGNGGRPKGSRNKFGEAFIDAIYSDFREHGEAAIQAVREEDPAAYLRVCAGILPREVKVEVSELEAMSDKDLDSAIRALADAVGLALGAGEALAGEETASGIQQARGVRTLQ